MESGTDANRRSADPESAATQPAAAVEVQAGAPSPALSNQDADVERTAAGLSKAIERMHERDRQRLAAGEITAEHLHLIPVEMAKRSVVIWTEAAVRRFRR